MERRRILYVDDEPENLLVFRMAFRNDYEIVTCSSGAEGLGFLEKESFPVVLADQRMPEMSGVDFLRQVRERWPHTYRIVLTAYADLNAVIDAVNLGHIYHFLRKPWEREEVAVVLRNALDACDLQRRNQALTDEILKKERLATVGRFVSGLAHEIRNQLNVRSFTEAILARYPSDTFLSERVEAIGNALTVIYVMVEEIRDFTQGLAEPLELRTNDLGRLVVETLALLRFDTEVSEVKLETTIAGSALVNCHSDKIKQVVFNLVKNAAQATNGRANAEVSIEVAHDPKRQVVRMSVTDNGSGISPENLSHVFEPFFTTKGDIGTGLGLLICKRILDAHHGSITCRSTVGTGTTVEVTLPAAAVPAIA